MKRIMKIIAGYPARFSRKPSTALIGKLRSTIIAAAILSFFTINPGIPAQSPPPGVLVGSTLNASIRNATAATQVQANAVWNTARAWGRRADSPYYRGDNFQSDLGIMQVQFNGLRERFNWTGYLVLQLGRPQSANVIAELDAGLNLILELLVFLENQFAAGALDRAAIVRTCRILDETTREWENVLKRSSSSLSY